MKSLSKSFCLVLAVMAPLMVQAQPMIEMDDLNGRSLRADHSPNELWAFLENLAETPSVPLTIELDWTLRVSLLATGQTLWVTLPTGEEVPINGSYSSAVRIPQDPREPSKFVPFEISVSLRGAYNESSASVLYQFEPRDGMNPRTQIAIERLGRLVYSFELEHIVYSAVHEEDWDRPVEVRQFVRVLDRVVVQVGRNQLGRLKVNVENEYGKIYYGPIIRYR